MKAVGFASVLASALSEAQSFTDRSPLEKHLWERSYFQAWIQGSMLPDIFRILRIL